MKKSENKNRSRAARNRRGMFVIMFVVCVLFGILCVQEYQMRAQIRENDAVTRQLSEQIAYEQERAENADAQREYMQSEEFIKKTAREKLGLVEEGEILFKETKN